MDQFNQFLKVFQALEHEKVDYILIGGFALVLQGMQRLTQDIDIFLHLAPPNIDKCKQALFSIFQDHAIDEISSQELTKYPVIRYGTPDGFTIDIMIRLGEAFSFDDLSYEVIECRGVKIKVATIETLYTLKKDTLRERDKVDALFLKRLIEEKKRK
jgi:predicted nucleotidyltransferase